MDIIKYRVVGMDEREKLIELVTSQQVTNAEFFNALRNSTPLLAELMMDKFKAFLDDSYFTDIERQTTLMKFFEEQTDIDTVKEILTFLENCGCKEDYTKIIMEWTYHNSDEIVKQNLAKVDGVSLYSRKPKKNKLEKPIDLTDEALQNIVQAVIESLGDGGIGGI